MTGYRFELHLRDDGPWLEVASGDLPRATSVSVRYALSETGKLVATSVRIDAAPGAEVTSTSLRLPLAEIMDQAARCMASADGHRRLLGELLAYLGIGVEGPPPPGDPGLAASVKRLSPVGAPMVPKRAPRGGWPREFYAEVASTYRVALRERPEDPTGAVCEHFRRPPSTVRRWLARARTMGLLGADERFRPSNSRGGAG